MRVRLAIGCVAALAGCDGVFRLTHILPATDAPIDVARSSGPCPAVAIGPDEDGDGCADTVDNCPGIHNVDQADSDGDGVGDVCDPHPTLRGDSITVMAFFDTNVDGGWVADPSWTVAQGAISNNDTAQAAELDHPALGVIGGYPTIELKFTAVAYTSGVSTLRLTITDPASSAVVCHVDRNDPTFDAFLDDAPGSVSTVNATETFTLGVDALGTRCTFGATLVSPDTLQPTLVDVSIQLMQFQVAIAYIIAYQYTPI